MFYLLTIPASFILPNADAVESLEQSIEATERRLEAQRKLKTLLTDYAALKKVFLQDNPSRTDAWRMVKTAEQACKLIEEAHLQPLFAAEFFEELKVFASYATKSSITLKGKGT